MLNYAQLVSPSFALFILLITNLLVSTNSSPNYVPKDHYYISCGLHHRSSPDGGTWRSDEDPTFSPSALAMAAATTSATGDYGAEPPYDTARIFHAPFSYSIPLSSPGPMLVRLYFSTSTRYNNMDPSNFYLSVNANAFNLLTNFSAYLAAANANTNPKYNAPVSTDVQGLGFVKEFYITVLESDQRLLNLTFLPVPATGFVNGIEIISVPDRLYVPDSNYSTDPSVGVGVPYLQGDYYLNMFNFSNHSKLAMETIIRLNVGGSEVDPFEDSGFNRTWYPDGNFLMFGKLHSVTPYHALTEINYKRSTTPPYIAPEIVYLSMRMMGAHLDPKLKLRSNLSWVFEVDGGFNYLVRLHFCEILKEIKSPSQVNFDIYINNQTAEKEFDVIVDAGGPGIPIHKDYVTYVDASGDDNSRHGSRVHLWVALHPFQVGIDDAFLNGLEIFKLNKEDGSLAAPNPWVIVPDHAPKNATSEGKRSNHWVVPVVVVGGVLGFIFLLTFTLFYFHRGRKQGSEASMLSNKPNNKTKWVPLPTFEFNSTTSSNVASSLASDLCRRFSLSQIRVATSEFDDSSIIGIGGFGKVYKGVIDGGATTVAIKRLNPTSKQGAHEFLTEIEMLSRLRHLHLVSLIGYCEDQGEMILVYEYMPRGTLRDHLMYKNTDINSSPLSWNQRLKICIGSARGLHYLHVGTKELIIHRDVKSTNILLDERWTAKVSDFGLSKVGPTSESGVGHVSTAVKGSVGYLDPEYYKRQRLTEKSDVYSFGVVLFEVLCARPAANPNLPREQVNLALWARKCYKDGILKTIVDPNLTGQIAPECLSKFGEIAETCVRDEGSQRPSMGDVVGSLEFALQLQETADKNNNNMNDGGPQLESLGPIPISTEENKGTGDAGGATDDDHDNSMFSATVDNLSQCSDTAPMMMGKNNSTTTSEWSYGQIGMRSGSIFSEIKDPQAR